MALVERSPRFPSGVATTYRVPGISAASRGSYVSRALNIERAGGPARLRAVDHPARPGVWRRGAPAAQARCCLIFPSSVALGTEPITVSTCCPFLKNRMLGIERTLNRIAVRWFASTSTLATLALPTYSPAFFFSDTATTEIYTLSLHDDLTPP